MRDVTTSLLRCGALALFAAIALCGCGPEPCVELACAIAECANPPSDECLDIDSDPECLDGVNDCAECYLDNVADVCHPTLEELAACTEACGG